MASYNTEGVVLKRVDFGEADRILTVLSKNRGKISCIAKGVRKIESKKSGHIELLNQVKLGVAEGRNLDIVTEAEVINTFRNIKSDLNKVASSYKVLELVESITQEDQENYSVYNLLLTILSYLNSETDKEQIQSYLRAFEIKLLGTSGFRPNMATCIKCQQILIPRENFLCPDLGGIVDSSCIRDSLLVRPMTPEAIKIMRFLQDEDWSQIEKLKIPLSLGKEIEQHLKFYWEYILEKELKSHNFVQRLS